MINLISNVLVDGTSPGSTPKSTINISSTGGTQPVSNVQPVLGMNYIIVLQGIYPSRS